jgi:hypothetical protein
VHKTSADNGVHFELPIMHSTRSDKRAVSAVYTVPGHIIIALEITR